MKNPFERFSFNKKNVKLAAGVVATLAASGDLKAADTTKLPSEGDSPLNINYDNPISFNNDPSVYGLAPKESLGFERTKKKETLTGGGPEVDPSFEEGDPITLASAYFKTGTVEYRNSEARESAKNAIRAFLRSVDLKNSKVIVTGYSSKERPTNANQTLAEQRTAEGVRLVHEILEEEYNGQTIIIESFVASDASIYDDMTDEEILALEKIKAANPEEFKKIVNPKIDEKEAIGIKAVTVEPARKEPKPEKVNQLEDYGYIVIDGSQSMKNDVADVNTELKRIAKEKGKKIPIVGLEGGNTEAHLTTLYNLLNGLKGPFDGMKILVVTDEPDNRLAKGNYENNISHVLGLAKDKKVEIVIKVFNPDKGVGGYKTFLLNKNRAALLAPDYYQEGNSQKDWYQKLPNENI